MRNILLGALLLSAAVIPAFAQTTTPAAEPRFVSVTDTSVLSSNVIGLNVLNAGDETIGEIKDVVVSKENGIEGFVVSVGGFLGVGEHYVVVDPAAMAVSYDASNKKWQARMNATADQLKAAPAFTYEGKWKS
ncbi:PRC-barrel domain-containing protein [Mesorhizobium retamae]|uniref:PRC-barrel domain-containing protein n=1 Tax=Mesorhizobium retamae TaxID=2912854 RepID=A0ABS9QBC0_9HYPH|nr:PRC-barrel domain-containing protein [Mesorhizobium sp. IRAMC:0171]MCG7504710.1 PRC-barrel domain-containing protein [Mesorhizobium sp. IRAMC:0171]